VDRLGVLPCVFQICSLRLHPEQVGEWRRCERLCNGVGNAAANLVIPFGSLGRLAVPVDVNVELACLLACSIERGAGRKAPPFFGAHFERLALVCSKLEHLGHRLTEGPEISLLLPCFQEAFCHLVEH
jgi:hypothetical protein